MPLIAELAQAVTDELNGGSFPLPFTAVRGYAPEYELPDMKDLHVTVVPKGLAVASAGRTANQYDCAVDIAVQKKVASTEPSELDPLMRLTEEIADFFRLRRLSAFPYAVWAGTEHTPIFAPEHLRELRQFTSVVTLNFRLLK
jgi:hypothetical protein